MWEHIEEVCILEGKMGLELTNMKYKNRLLTVQNLKTPRTFKE